MSKTDLPVVTAESRVVSGGPPEAPSADILFHRRIRILPSTRELWRFRELVLTLAERDLRVRYKQAVLGIAWALVTPLLLLVAFALVFTKLGHVKAAGVPYPLFAAIGLVPWTFFSSGFSRGATSLVNNIPLLNKTYCPREVFPLASVALALADALAALAVLVVLFPLEGYAPRWQSIYAPALLLIALLYTVGLTLAVSAIVVYLRDLQVVLPLFVQFGLFATPVGYAGSAVVSSTTGQILMAVVNPLAPVIDGLRRGVLFGESPQLLPTLAGAASSVVVLLVGYVVFKHMEAGLADIA